jgi:SpoVK/Ycf46/Vps4 family AAA+-type ATPase
LFTKPDLPDKKKDSPSSSSSSSNDYNNKNNNKKEKNLQSDDPAWWKGSKALRALYHPLLKFADADYKRWLEEEAKRANLRESAQKALQEAENSVKKFESSLKDLIGYENVIDEIMSSVYYWVYADEDFRKICPAAPPKVFIVKGASGTGKTTLAESIMVEAFRIGKGRNIPVFAFKMSLHQIYEKWLGESEKKIAQFFDQAFQKPSIIFMDEAHALAQSMASSTKPEDSGMQAYLNVQTTLLEKINELTVQNVKCILILATNEYGSISEAVRRRTSGGVIDLDNEITRSMLLSLTEAQIAKYSLTTLSPDEVLRTIENKVRALGHSSVTPADITSAFQIVLENKTRNLRASYIRKFAKAIRSTSNSEVNKKTQAEENLAVRIDDFRQIKQLKAYSEDRRSPEVKTIVTRIKPKIRLDDVGGLSGVKEKLFKDMELSLDSDHAKRVGSRPIHGILLHGPPGCGKTWLAQAIAGELDATIYMIKGGQIIKPYHGQTEKIIIDVFDEARKNAPSIIIIDEVDSLTLKREMGGNLGAVTTLLSEMGGLKPLEGVVVIATTNKLQLVDEAFLRAGRFDRIIEIPPPKNDKERSEIIAVHLRTSQSFVDKSVTPEAIVRLFGKRTFTPAKIERLISDANELRAKELRAANKLADSLNRGDKLQEEKIFQIYGEDIERLRAHIFEVSASAPTTSSSTASTKELSPQLISSISPDNYLLTLQHFCKALELSSDQNVEEIKRITTSLRGESPQPTVGKVYGLAALSGIGETPGSEGTIAVIECVANPYGRRGRAVVIGSEVASSIKASAEHARVFLNEQCDWMIRDYEFYLDFITFAKGLDQKIIQGPSAGAAITLAEFSSATKTKVLPNVVITGAVTPKGELVQVGGLDFKGMGKFVAALNTDGVDTIIIPESNFNMLNSEDKDFFEERGLKIIPAQTFWDVARESLEGHPCKEEALEQLRTNHDQNTRRLNQ